MSYRALVSDPTDRPECTVRKDYDDQRNVVLICRSVAYPAVSNFSWFRDNVSLNVQQRNGRHESTLVLKSDDNLARYSCISSNALGLSEPCKLQLTSLPGKTMSCPQHVIVT
ncbi:hypothetical protein AVEN_119526-1 [Araneus ventricosus]|uniref:Ig-like domain-containing protein n=1 Tax=Araneus ventricosus TaxID=182803 RepID=A0A4Y2JCI8_ARAVE|nr:hypothetical protein AVEN_119526-1 [Araneus ventricosus]